MRVLAVRSRIFRENENLSAFVRQHIRKIPEGGVIVVASKIVALSEGRVVQKNTSPHQKQREQLIRRESSAAFRTPHVWLTIKENMLMPNAGIDESNGNGNFLLLPTDSFRSASHLQKELRRAYKVRKLGVIISDSALSPLRAGVTAHALGYAGIKGVRDYRGKRDIFGRKLRMTSTNVVDSLATAAALLMGEGSEQQPLALITEAPVQFAVRMNRREATISPKDDIYAPLLKKLRPDI